MTAEELLDEIRADYPNVLTISDGKDAKVIRIIKKSVLLPVRIHSFVTTVRKKQVADIMGGSQQKRDRR